MLTEDELVKVWRGAKKLGWPYGAAFRMLILTSARREEIGQLRWSEIVGDTINLEGARTKNGEPHIIPLSTPALTLLDQLPRIADSDFVFTISGKSPSARWSGPKADLDDLAQIATWRTHDLRRTTATGLQKLGVPLQVTEAILGHECWFQGRRRRHLSAARLCHREARSTGGVGRTRHGAARGSSPRQGGANAGEALNINSICLVV